MTDRLDSCRDSPDGCHGLTVDDDGYVCRHCRRRGYPIPRKQPSGYLIGVDIAFYPPGHDPDAHLGSVGTE